uniref:Cap10 n=1 Tax=Hyphomicrobiales TaxID=356 RepID=UPI000AA47D31
MLAKRRGFYLDGNEIIRTPLLLPSFSSKGFPEVQEIIEATSDVIDGPCLISAYDLHYGSIKGPYDFAQAIFIDSGGYEASKDVELSDLGTMPHTPAEWSQDDFSRIIGSWQSPTPTVLVSYDHPKDRLPTRAQIERADAMLPKRPHTFREILFKPERVATGGTSEPPEVTRVNVSAIVDNIGMMARFDALGITEKEVGGNLKERMVNIARIRRALDKVKLTRMPIHVFGSLDTVTTPLYFLAGADVFDGLTWLRFAYYKGMTIYRQNYAAVELGIDMKAHLVDAKCCFDNYRYMKGLEGEMRGFLKEGFASFEHHRPLLERACRAVLEETEV